MLCDNCKKNPATVHMVKVINGVKTEQHLCAECAQKNNELSFNKDSIADFFPFFGQMPQVKKAAFEPCPTCGMSFAELQKSGLVGCDKCYAHFKPYIAQLLPRIQKGNEHQGKVPGKDYAELTKAKELQALKTEMTKCILAEEFEKAAELRDKIRALEGGAK
ncbi:MAG: UvrB/UvrC motif-containing protein [Firmicutes bacterium]|nr:UvrB/UvrC motif-containing protein [Bacillota bacterium]